MKTLVKVINVEDGYVNYQEICRKSGKVMIEDYMTVDNFFTALESEFGLELENVAEYWKLKFDTSSQMWANNNPLTAAQYIVNQCLKDNLVARITFSRYNWGSYDNVIDFTDGSLIVFKSGNWVEKGFYCQTQSCRA